MTDALLIDVEPAGAGIYEFGEATRDAEHFRGERQVVPRAHELERIRDVLWRRSDRLYLTSTFRADEWDWPFNASWENTAQLCLAVDRFPVRKAAILRVGVVADTGSLTLVLAADPRLTDAARVLGTDSKRWHEWSPILATGRSMWLRADLTELSGPAIHLYGSFEDFLELKTRPVPIRARGDHRIQVRGRTIPWPPVD